MNRLSAFILAIILLECFSDIHAVDTAWGYTGSSLKPNDWVKQYKACGGLQQSPINIELSEVVTNLDLKPPTIVENPSDNTPNFDVTNDGHKISITFPDDYNTVDFGSDSNLKFCPKQVHWHWGANSDRGSEHTIDGKAFPIEGHIVMWNCIYYNSFTEAVKSPSGLAVLGILYEVVDDNKVNNGYIPSIVQVLSNPGIRKAETSKAGTTTIPRFSMMKLLPENPYAFYRYSGSLTTPSCTENVLWTVFKDRVGITEKQLEAFRNLLYIDGTAMVNNFRPVQPLTRPGSLAINRAVSSNVNNESPKVLTNVLTTLLYFAAIVTTRYLV